MTTSLVLYPDCNWKWSSIDNAELHCMGQVDKYDLGDFNLYLRVDHDILGLEPNHLATNFLDEVFDKDIVVGEPVYGIAVIMRKDSKTWTKDETNLYENWLKID